MWRAAPASTIAALLLCACGSDSTSSPAAPVDTPLSIQPSRVIQSLVADVDGDGRPDVLLFVADFPVAGFSRSMALLSNPDGTFRAVPPSAAPAPSRPIVADVDADGKADLAACGAGGLTLALGNGDGTFREQAVIAPLPAGCDTLAAGDFNGDGKLDLMAFRFGGDATLATRSPDGGFTVTRVPMPPPLGRALRAIAVRLAPDARDGLVLVKDTPGAGQGWIEAYVFDASGVPRRTSEIVPSRAVTAAVVADTDRDGHPDIVALTQALVPFNVPPPLDDEITLRRFPGLGGGLFGAESWSRPSPGTTGFETVGFSLGDVDGDGLPDLAVLQLISGKIELRILKGKPDGTFEEPAAARFSEPAAPDGWAEVHTADLNGDGKSEVIVVFRDRVRVLRGE